jgi:hypothetical protein
VSEVKAIGGCGQAQSFPTLPNQPNFAFYTPVFTCCGCIHSQSRTSINELDELVVSVNITIVHLIRSGPIGTVELCISEEQGTNTTCPVDPARPDKDNIIVEVGLNVSQPRM